MARYRRLTLTEREELSRMLAAGYSLRATGQALSRAPSTLSRELSRHHAGTATTRLNPPAAIAQVSALSPPRTT